MVHVSASTQRILICAGLLKCHAQKCKQFKTEQIYLRAKQFDIQVGYSGGGISSKRWCEKGTVKRRTPAP